MSGFFSFVLSTSVIHDIKAAQSKCENHFMYTCLFSANPIDLLAKYVNMTEDDVDIEIQEPYHLLKVHF